LSTMMRKRSKIFVSIASYRDPLVSGETELEQALAYGLPIATGVIEGPCRHLVKDRMDITGGRWGLERAEAILKLHSVKVGGNLPAFLAFHFKQWRKRNHLGPPIPLALSEAA
jgi:hypothetical protein